MASDIESRPYRSRLRQEQAAETRRRIAAAAQRLFEEKGWARTSLRAVAEAAGVSEATVYAAYGSKVGLTSALVDSVEDLADFEETRVALEATAGDPQSQLRILAAFDRRLVETAGDVIELVREAGRSEPELARFYSQGRARAEQVRRTVFSSWPAGSLAAGVDTERAIDIALALCNLDVYRTLTQDRGWTPDQVEEWWYEVQVKLLLEEHNQRKR